MSAMSFHIEVAASCAGKEHGSQQYNISARRDSEPIE